MRSFQGTYSDGHSANRIAVEAVLTDTALAVRDERGRAVAEWRYGDLRLVEEVYSGQPVRLRPRRGDARLVVREPGFLAALAPHARQLRGHDMQKSRALPRIAIWGAATIGTVVALYFGLPFLAEPVAAIVPLAWEERLGRSVRAQATSLFGRDAKECAAEDGRKALEGLVARLSATVETRYTFRVQVIDSSMVNAFAAPAGYIVVFRGLIDRSQTSEELAGVLAHEMGHVIERHGTEALIRQAGMKVLAGAMIGDASSVGSTAGDIGAHLAALSYNRAAEREADRVGIEILNRADIRGEGLAAFFQRLAKLGGDGSAMFRYVRTHPPSGERAQNVASAITGRGDAMTGREWEALRAICMVKR